MRSRLSERAPSKCLPSSSSFVLLFCPRYSPIVAITAFEGTLRAKISGHRVESSAFRAAARSRSGAPRAAVTVASSAMSNFDEMKKKWSEDFSITVFSLFLFPFPSRPLPFTSSFLFCMPPARSGLEVSAGRRLCRCEILRRRSKEFSIFRRFDRSATTASSFSSSQKRIFQRPLTPLSPPQSPNGSSQVFKFSVYLAVSWSISKQEKNEKEKTRVD